MKKLILPLLLFSMLFQLTGQNLFPAPGPVFKDEVIPTINILIPPDSLDILLAPGNEESNYHWHATFIFNNGDIIDTVENIGFRLRGNTSRYADKKSFKISFNTYEPGRKWQGLEKLNINGEHNDPSVARSKIAWDLEREMGVPSPRSNHINLYVNYQFVGLFLNVEHIDEVFVQSRFGNNDGNLYKCLWPADLNYKGNDPNLYKESLNGRRTYDLKTNKDEDDYTGLAHFIDVLNNTPINNLSCELEKIFNVDTYLKAMALDILIGNWDGPIFNKNNFYLYHNASTGLFEYIPFDLDNTIGIDWFNINWSSRDIYEWGSSNEFRPIYEQLLKVPAYRDRFSFYMQRFLNEFYNEDNLFPYVENIKNLISSSVGNDILYPLDYGFDVQDFNNAFEMELNYFHTPIGIKEFITQRHNTAIQQLQLNNIAPVISTVQNNFPNAFQDIVITATIEDDEFVSTAEILYQINNQPQQTAPLYDDGQHADGIADDGIYGFTFNPIGSNSTFRYIVQSTDESGALAQYPVCGFNEILIGSTDVPLTINEFMASNDFSILDQFGEADDWVEIFSLSDVPLYLGNYFFSDDPGAPNKWQLPDISIQPGEYLIFWADGDEAQGEFHMNFKLNKEGEFIGLFDGAANNFAMIDGINFGQQSTDVSLARIPNGTGPFQFNLPTPNAFNEVLTAINETEDLIDIKVSPNPFSDELNISSNDLIHQATLYDMTGKLLLEKNNILQNSFTMNTTSLNPGKYFLTIVWNKDKVISKKIILQR